MPTTVPTPASTRLLAILSAAAVLSVTACGGGSDPDGDPAADPGGTESAAPATTDEAMASAVDAVESATSEEDVSSAADDLADDLAEDLEGQQAAHGGGSATLTVGDQTWEFGSVLCAFGEEQIGQEGAEFVLSSLQDGLQLYASVDSFGHLVTLDDIENYDDPSVSLQSRADGDFLEISGTQVTAQFPVAESESFDPADVQDATLEASCP